MKTQKSAVSRQWSVAWGIMLLSALCASALTPFSYQFYNSDGTAQTNPFSMMAWPPSTNGWTVYGTNIIWGSQTITLQPGTNGYGTNAGAYPNIYRLFNTNLNSGFYVQIPDTNAQVSLGSCIIGAPQVAGPVTFYSQITNALGFAPVASNYLSIVGALTYTPATNSLQGITNALGYIPPTNSYPALTNILAFVPATNGINALTNVLGYNPQNATYAALTNTLAFVPATNGLAALTNTLTSAGLLSVLGTIPQSSLAQIGYVGVTNLNGAMLTNRATGQVICFTNLAIGTAPTIGLPDGSLIISTNGNVYVRSNATAVNLK